jgi:ABC-2 type transport system permease protein
VSIDPFALRPPVQDRYALAYQARIARVLAATQFKVKYADSVLGYFWSLAKPLALFSILYVVFGRALRFDAELQHYPLFLLLGVVLFSFFSDATNTTMTSLASQSSVLRKLSFPRLTIPLSFTLNALITFSINMVAVVAFLAWNRIVPRPNWLLLVPLLAELFLFVFGLSLILATLYVRFRDISQIWELGIRMFFYAFAIIYPLQILPLWAERTILLNPFAQVMQDMRSLVLYDDRIVTVSGVLGGPVLGHLAPLGATIAIFALGLFLFKRQEPWFAERV